MFEIHKFHITVMYYWGKSYYLFTHNLIKTLSFTYNLQCCMTANETEV